MKEAFVPLKSISPIFAAWPDMLYGKFADTISTISLVKCWSSPVLCPPPLYHTQQSGMGGLPEWAERSTEKQHTCTMHINITKYTVHTWINIHIKTYMNTNKITKINIQKTWIQT